MSNFTSDNFLLSLNPTLTDLCNLPAMKSQSTSIRPEHMPLLVGVEAVREKGAPADAQQIATRYCLVFPGSNYLRVTVKVEERAPSITQEVLEKYPGGIRVQIQGFYAGAFLTKDGGAMPFFKAERVIPIQPQTSK